MKSYFGFQHPVAGLLMGVLTLLGLFPCSLLAAAAIGPPALKAAPTVVGPELMSFQGDLRDGSGKALNGTYDMTFRLYDAVSGGTLLLTDAHSGPGASVTVSEGLFDTVLGGGTVTPGSQASLGAVFANLSAVWVEIQVGGETLSPRMQVTSAAYAQNARALDGRGPSEFAGAIHQHTGADVTSPVAEATVATNATNAGNADTLDGQHAAAFAGSVHGHAGTDITGPVPNATYASTAGDSDTLDGQHATAFAGSVHGHAGTDITGPVPNATYASTAGDSDTLDGQDAAAFAGAVHGHAGTDISGPVAQATTATTATNAGNADTLDGEHASAFADSVHGHQGSDIAGAVALATAAATATSAGDSDKLDGQHAAAFATSSHDHDAAAITTGTVPAAHGGTGLTSPGADGNLLTSNGTTWTSAAPPTAGALGAVVDAANTTLTRSGSGTAVSPYKLALNLTKANTWSGAQTFQADTLFPGGGTWTSTGRVGIGIASPEYPLHVEEFEAVALLRSTSNTNGARVLLQNETPSPNTIGQVRFSKDNVSGAVTYTGSHKLQLSANNSTYMTLSSNGDVGFGTIYPADSIHIDKPSATLRLSSDNTPYGSHIYLSNSTPGAQTLGMVDFSSDQSYSRNFLSCSADNKLQFATDGSVRMTLNASGNLGIKSTNPGFPLTFANQTGDKISLYSDSATEIYGMGIASSLLQVYTSKSSSDIAFGYGSNASFTERVRFKGNGRVGIGLNPSHQLQLSSDDAAKPGTNTWTVVSDTRLKKDIVPFTDGLAVLEKIRPISYRYNGMAGMPRDMPCIGVSAQEIREVAPYTVGTFWAKLDERDEAETELYDFNSHALTFMLINAVKELDGKIEALSGKKPQQDFPEARGDAGSSAPPGTAPARPSRLPADPDAPAPIPPSLPVSERFPVCEGATEGDVLVADASYPDAFCLGRQAADPKVVGISTGVTSPGEGEGGSAYPAVPVATSGIVICKVDAGYGPIAVGDLLATSPTAGHAQKATDPRPGTVLGKALEPLEAGTGTIRVLVMLR